MEDSEEELKSLLMKVKEESEKAGLKLDSSWVTGSHLELLKGILPPSYPGTSSLRP